ncbi:hypothetical protein TNCT_285311 [Trichonephila clavata]|uniref:Uncharacterized protein n=1 Tax=Trichonephila clavata TaxID=2740835 RepID=A0A8X6FQT2_TRICU|nr:hypothetical protein TNCT_678091 [Trichonephila clavata]GFR30551.1 hypothetical protein TNCT_285311 [Trichonephila clavata]
MSSKKQTDFPADNQGGPPAVENTPSNDPQINGICFITLFLQFTGRPFPPGVSWIGMNHPHRVCHRFILASVIFLNYADF